MPTFSPADPSFPEACARATPPIESLRVRGTLPESFARAVALVGTRSADDEALAFTRRLAAELAEAGCVIVSGGARGVDAAAHQGALDAGGVTVAVLASGFAPPYPRGNGALFDAIVDRGGALVSELPDGTAPLRGRFLARNRVIAALSRVVVVIQAPIPSGALNTAATARKLKIPVMSVPSAPWDVRSTGTLALIAGGALVCTSARDVLSVPALSGRDVTDGPTTPSENICDFSGFDPVARQILEDLGSRPRHPDEIADRTGLSAREVQQVVIRLLLEGLVEARPGGRFRLCRSPSY